MADGEADDVGLDLVERTEVAVGRIERDVGSARDRLLAATLAERWGEVRAPAAEARLDGDVREMIGGERGAVALERGAEQHADELAHVARPAVAHQHR